LARSAAENEGVKRLIEDLAVEVEKIDEVLVSADSYEVADTQRDRLIDQKRIYNRILSYFTDAAVQLKRLEDEVDKNL
jgi:uncharacterized protein involved in exopolysaccharide biosynthesis